MNEQEETALAEQWVDRHYGRTRHPVGSIRYTLDGCDPVFGYQVRAWRVLHLVPQTQWADGSWTEVMVSVEQYASPTDTGYHCFKYKELYVSPSTCIRAEILRISRGNPNLFEDQRVQLLLISALQYL